MSFGDPLNLQSELALSPEALLRLREVTGEKHDFQFKLLTASQGLKRGSWSGMEVQVWIHEPTGFESVGPLYLVCTQVSEI